MAKTYQSILDEARVLLQDTDPLPDYRYLDEVLIAKLNRALQELARLRPDAYDLFYTDVVVGLGGSLNVPEVTTGNLSTTFPLDLMFYTPVVYFVVGSAELVDDEYTNDGRVSALMSQFRTMLVGL